MGPGGHILFDTPPVIPSADIILEPDQQTITLPAVTVDTLYLVTYGYGVALTEGGIMSFELELGGVGLDYTRLYEIVFLQVFSKTNFISQPAGPAITLKLVNTSHTTDVSKTPINAVVDAGSDGMTGAQGFITITKIN